MVGAVIVRQGKVVATGYHRFAGGDHAELVALKRAGARAKNATLYINLEPCSHYGRTPPCTSSIVSAGIKEIVAGMKDPNPLVAGSGFRQLRQAGIRVRVGILEEECRALNEAFTKYITRGIPFVVLKVAATLDGKIATARGDAHWVSDAESRLLVHKMRNELDAVVVGARTVLADNPQLTCRLPGGRDPWRVILDGRLRIPLSARVLHQRRVEKNIVVTSLRAPRKKVKALRDLGAQVWQLPAYGARIRWMPVLKKLAAMGVVSVMIEGGATTARWALAEKIVDKIHFFYAPKIVGGDGRVMVDGLGITRMSQSIRVQKVTIKNSGTDFLVSGYVVY
jgi:diaminohydroxyphosphoribosylaminopyrimidine deaminase/5-amino-6-(5-phosphoribosylamino)uracil reductase